MSYIQTKSGKKHECDILFQKALELKDNEYLFTTFGANYSYTIERRGENFILKVWQCYHTMEYKPISETDIKDGGDISFWLTIYPSHYAANHFTGKLDFMDNWINFVKAFKVRQYKLDDKYTH
jgi:hypothetical protein